MVQAASKQLNGKVTRFGEIKEGARKFHREEIGDVDPDRCFADFIFQIYQASSKHYGESQPAMQRLKKVYRSPKEKAAMASTSGLVGGYIVPPELRLDLMKDVAEDAIVRPRAMVVSMGSGSLQLPLPDAGETPTAGIAPEWGLMQMSFTAQGVQLPETEPQWRVVSLNAWALGGFLVGSNQMLDDGKEGMESVLRFMIARSIGWYEDFFFLRGSGVGQPLGMANATNSGAIFVTRSGGNTFTIIDVGKMAQAILPISWSRAQWLVHPQVWPQLVALNTNAWQANQPIKQGRIYPDAILNGMGLWVSEKMQILGTQGDVALLDCGLYVIGDRGEIHIDVSREASSTTFQQNQSVWRVVERVDGQPWLGKSVTLQDASTKCSGYVVLV